MTNPRRPCAPSALPRRRSTPLWSLLLAPLLVLTGCGGSYTIEGRVVRGSLGMVTIVDADDARLEGTPLGGANIRAIRDPGRLNSEELGSAVAGPDGTFRLKINSFGAGLLNEDWLIIASRGGTSGAEGIVSLPRSPGKKRLLVTLSAGAPSDPNDRWGSSTEDLMRDFDRYR